MSGGVVVGFDEAGRGPVIGPMVMACAVFDSSGAAKLSDLGVKDSKKLSAKKRYELEPRIKEIAIEWSTVHISPAEIDRLRLKMSLNVVEARAIAKMLIGLSTQVSQVIVDAADAVAENYAKKIMDAVYEFDPEFIVSEMICEHRADDNYIEVSGASVIAKVERDLAIEALKRDYGDLGSGYPADPVTQAFIKRLMSEGPLPDFVRKSWNTVSAKKQTTLGDF